MVKKTSRSYIVPTKYQEKKDEKETVTATVHDELTWGIIYRNVHTPGNGPPIGTMPSPMSIHRVDRIIKKKIVRPTAPSECDDPPKSPPVKTVESRIVKRKLKKRRQCYPAGTPDLHARPVQISLLNRSILNQKQYCNVLCYTPIRCIHSPRRPKTHKCVKDICPPRITKLSLPSKRQVYYNWKTYQNFLPAEMLTRFDELLHTDQNIKPFEIRHYFKKVDKKRKLQFQKSKKKKKKQMNTMRCCLKKEVKKIASLIVEYLLNERLFDLSYKQILIASMIINFVQGTGCVKTWLTRSTNKVFPSTIIEVCDKIAVWVDMLVKVVDHQPVDGEDDEMVTLESLNSDLLFGKGEGEGETDMIAQVLAL